MYIHLYNVCAMILTFVRLGVIFFSSLRQECHVKIKAVSQFLVKVSQMTRVPQFENHCSIVYIRDGKTRPSPRALRAETGLMIFYLRFLCALCAGRWVVTRELCIVVTCKCVVY